MKSWHTLAAFFPSLVVGPDDDWVVGAGEVLTASFSGAGEAGLRAESTAGTSGEALAAGTSLGSASAVGAAKYIIEVTISSMNDTAAAFHVQKL